MTWRRAMEWVMWSPKRLIATAIVGVAALVLIGSQLSGGTQHRTVSRSFVAARTPNTSHPPGGTPAPSLNYVLGKAAGQAAETFVSDWARPQLPEPQWYGALQPLATPSYANSLADQQPWSVTATKVTGNPTGSSSSTSATVTVPTDAGPVVVSLRKSGGKWLVSDVEEG